MNSQPHQRSHLQYVYIGKQLPTWGRPIMKAERSKLVHFKNHIAPPPRVVASKLVQYIYEQSHFDAPFSSPKRATRSLLSTYRSSVGWTLLAPLSSRFQRLLYCSTLSFSRSSSSLRRAAAADTLMPSRRAATPTLQFLQFDASVSELARDLLVHGVRCLAHLRFARFELCPKCVCSC